MLKLDSNITTGFEELNLFGLNNKFNKGRRSPAGAVWDAVSPLCLKS